MKILRSIPMIPWWLLYNLFNLHDKYYDTRTLRGWGSVRHRPAVYVAGWLFWIVVAAALWLLL